MTAIAALVALLTVFVYPPLGMPAIFLAATATCGCRRRAEMRREPRLPTHGREEQAATRAECCD